MVRKGKKKSKPSSPTPPPAPLSPDLAAIQHQIAALEIDLDAMGVFNQALFEWEELYIASGHRPEWLAAWSTPAFAADFPQMTEFCRKQDQYAERARAVLKAIEDNYIAAAMFLERRGVDGSKLLRWANCQDPDELPPLCVDIQRALIRVGLSQEELRQRVSMTKAETPPLSAPPKIYCLGQAIYRVGDSRPYEVGPEEDDILQAFMRRPAMSEKTLIIETKNDNARIVLLRLREKYEGTFAAAILRPTGKSAGGYCAIVRETER